MGEGREKERGEKREKGREGGRSVKVDGVRSLIRTPALSD